MRTPVQTIAIAAIAVTLAGCQASDTSRRDGITLANGDAIAANTALQMVDPWPDGVDDVKLKSPADRKLGSKTPANNPPKTQ
jgi:hypothetical protein